MISSSSDNNNNRAVENQRSNYTFWDNVQFHSSLVNRVRAQDSSNSPRVVHRHEEDHLESLLMELDSDDGLVAKVCKRKRRQRTRRRTLAPLLAPVHKQELDRWLKELD